MSTAVYRAHLYEFQLLVVMAHLHCRRWTLVQTWIRNPVATLYYAQHFHIAQTRTWIPTPYWCISTVRLRFLFRLLYRFQ